jgi:hypothetical protein
MVVTRLAVPILQVVRAPPPGANRFGHSSRLHNGRHWPIRPHTRQSEKVERSLERPVSPCSPSTRRLSRHNVSMTDRIGSREEEFVVGAGTMARGRGREKGGQGEGRMEAGRTGVGARDKESKGQSRTKLKVQ